MNTINAIKQDRNLAQFVIIINGVKLDYEGLITGLRLDILSHGCDPDDYEMSCQEIRTRNMFKSLFVLKANVLFTPAIRQVYFQAMEIEPVDAYEPEKVAPVKNMIGKLMSRIKARS